MTERLSHDRCEGCEDALFELCAEGREDEARALAAGCESCEALLEDLLEISPALVADFAPEPDPFLLARTRRAATEALFERRRRRVRRTLPVAAAAMLPVALGWNALVAYGIYAVLLALLPEAIAGALAAVAAAGFGVATLTVGATVYGGLPILAARATEPAPLPAPVESS